MTAHFLYFSKRPNYLCKRNDKSLSTTRPTSNAQPCLATTFQSILKDFQPLDSYQRVRGMYRECIQAWYLKHTYI